MPRGRPRAEEIDKNPFAKALKTLLAGMRYEEFSGARMPPDACEALWVSRSKLCRWTKSFDSATPSYEDINKLAVLICVCGDGYSIVRRCQIQKRVTGEVAAGAAVVDCSCCGEVATSLLDSADMKIRAREIAIGSFSGTAFRRFLKAFFGTAGCIEWCERCGLAPERVATLSSCEQEALALTSAETQRLAVAISIAHDFGLVGALELSPCFTCSRIAEAVATLLFHLGHGHQAMGMTDTATIRQLVVDRLWRRDFSGAGPAKAQMVIGYVESFLVGCSHESESGDPDGVAANFAREVAVRITGNRPVWKRLEWDQLDDALTSGTIHATAPMTLGFLRRSHDIEFSNHLPYMQCGVNLVYSAAFEEKVVCDDDVQWDNLELEYDDESVGSYAVQTKPFTRCQHRRQRPDGRRGRSDLWCEYVDHPVTEDGLRVRCFVGGQLVCHTLAEAADGKLRLLYSNEQPSLFRYVFCVAPFEPTLRRKINFALREIAADERMLRSMFNDNDIEYLSKAHILSAEFHEKLGGVVPW